MHEGEMASNRSKLASLILDDGSVYKGKLFGSAKCIAGEVGKALLSVICFQKLTSRASNSRVRSLFLYSTEMVEISP